MPSPDSVSTHPAPELGIGSDLAEHESGPPGRGQRLLLAGGWLLAALALALGSAGIVSGVGGLPGTSARSELTYPTDSVLLPRLQSATGDLGQIRDDVDALGAYGRGALASVIDSNQHALASTIDDGATLALQIGGETDALRVKLRALPGVDGATSLPLPPTLALRMSPDLERRYAVLLSALDTTNGLSEAWSGLTSGSLAARRLSGLLADHDTSTAAAANLGRSGKWTAALKQLDTSDKAIADARAMRDKLAATVDVSTLDQWLNLNADYDTSLRTLYQALVRSKGKVTAAVHDAFVAQQAAYDRLPGDTRALVVIMGDLARGGINQAVTTIEEAKGRLNEALQALAAIELGIDASPPAGD